MTFSAVYRVYWYLYITLDLGNTCTCLIHAIIHRNTKQRNRSLSTPEENILVPRVPDSPDCTCILFHILRLK